jgi:hypothetical protein
MYVPWHPNKKHQPKNLIGNEHQLLTNGILVRCSVSRFHSIGSIITLQQINTHNKP